MKNSSILSWVALLGVCGLCQCSDSPAAPLSKGVVVTLAFDQPTTVPIGSLRVIGTLDGVPAKMGPQIVAGTKVPFTLVLPPGSHGHLDIGVEAATDTDLAMGAGHAGVDIGDANDYTATVTLARAYCRSSFCFDVPASRNLSFQGVWAAAPDDVWVVGEKGTVLHYDGFAFGLVESNTAANLHGVWGSGASDVVAVGDKDKNGTIIRWNGTTFVLAYTQMEPQESLTGVWGSGPADIWVTTTSGATLIHSVGANWPREGYDSASALNAVGGSGPKDVWAAGANLLVLHWLGEGWSPVPPPTTQQLTLYGLWAVAQNDVWFAGDKGMMLHWHDSMLLQAGPGGTTSFTSLWGSGPKDIWAAGRDGTLSHYDGNVWTSSPSNGTKDALLALWGTGPGDVWAVGNNGSIAHFDGRSWSVKHSGPGGAK